MKKNNLIKNFLFGIILGVSNVIPGVSGGTMAVILNIYDKVLLAFTKANIRKNLPFLIPLGLGTLIGIYSFSQLVTNLLEDHRILLTFAFGGIILGSIPAIFLRAKYGRAKGKNILLGLMAFVFMVALAYISTSAFPESGLFTGEVGQPTFYLWLFLASTLAMVAMLLPGISGSLVLLILGAYPIAMEAIAYFQWEILFVLALGLVTGGYAGIKGIQNMLRNHPQALYFIILGLVTGSLFILFPDIKVGLESPLNFAVLFFFLALSFGFGRKSTS
ncbi:MAG: DUF368 domain-containing protein [Anaerovoracaceae bacterium]|jgi:putative membrane protein|nr:DUF368 domain-containing protein [Anaerovoracaceae bacterium]